MKFLDRIERAMGKCYIPNLMKYLVIAMAGVFILDYLPLPNSASALLYFDRGLILQGQIWRLVTFMVVPPMSYSIITVVIELYFYYFLGTALENHWGSRRFNLYIFIGMVCVIIGGMLTGYAANQFLYTSLLLAFAMLYPDMEVLLFFILPVKIKYLGYFSAAVLVYQFIQYPGFYRISLLLSLVPFLLFFGKDCYLQGKMKLRHLQYWWNTREK